MKKLILERPQRYGGTQEFNSYNELEQEYAKGKIHPQDLKNSVGTELAKILAPIREHFEKKSDLLEVYKESDITR